MASTPGGPGNPIQELLNLRDRMNRLFEDSMGRFAPAEDAVTGGFVPPVDIFEDRDRIVLWLELPGVTREQAVEVGSLVIRGERRMDPSLRPDDFHRIERSFGPFRRTFKLPPGVRADGIQAEMRHGVLEVVVPRAAGGDGPARKVDVK